MLSTVTSFFQDLLDPTQNVPVATNTGVLDFAEAIAREQRKYDGLIRLKLIEIVRETIQRDKNQVSRLLLAIKSADSLFLSMFDPEMTRSKRRLRRTAQALRWTASGSTTGSESDDALLPEDCTYPPQELKEDIRALLHARLKKSLALGLTHSRGESIVGSEEEFQILCLYLLWSHPDVAEVFSGRGSVQKQSLPEPDDTMDLKTIPKAAHPSMIHTGPWFVMYRTDLPTRSSHSTYDPSFSSSSFDSTKTDLREQGRLIVLDLRFVASVDLMLNPESPHRPQQPADTADRDYKNYILCANDHVTNTLIIRDSERFFVTDNVSMTVPTNSMDSLEDEYSSNLFSEPLARQDKGGIYVSQKIYLPNFLGELVISKSDRYSHRSNKTRRTSKPLTLHDLTVYSLKQAQVIANRLFPMKAIPLPIKRPWKISPYLCPEYEFMTTGSFKFLHSTCASSKSLLKTISFHGKTSVAEKEDNGFDRLFRSNSMDSTMSSSNCDIYYYDELGICQFKDIECFGFLFVNTPVSESMDEFVESKSSKKLTTKLFQLLLLSDKHRGRIDE